MTKDEILEFINENRVFYLATCEDDQPHVRAMQLYQADPKGIVFITRKDKSLNLQLMVNPQVELCFYNEKNGIQVRIRGKARLVRDQKFRAAATRANPAAESIIRNEGPDGLAVYRLAEGRVRVWKVDKDFTPRLMANRRLQSIFMAMHNSSEPITK